MIPPIELGTMLFTMVDPHRGHEVNYNRWYESDHFYSGCMVAEWNFCGDRFVATRELKSLRYPTESPMTPDPMIGSYLALYGVIKGRHDEWNRWSVDEVNNLHREGRMYPERDHIHTLLYDFREAWKADPNGTSPEQALDRNYSGLVVNVGEFVGDTNNWDGLAAWTRSWADEHRGAEWAPDLVMTLAPIPLLDDAPADVGRIPNIERRFLQLHFCDHPAEAGWAGGWDTFGAALDASGVGRHLWTSPFRQTVFGTDRYTDELW